jgi:hypothetical protein
MLSEATLQKKYGISQEKWNELYRKQGGRCAICGCQQRYQSLAVDHCHKTKKVRGLLCVQCNRGLGRFFDSPVRLRRAADYIEQSRLPEKPENVTPPHGANALSPVLPPARLDEVQGL